MTCYRLNEIWRDVSVSYSVWFLFLSWFRQTSSEQKFHLKEDWNLNLNYVLDNTEKLLLILWDELMEL